MTEEEYFIKNFPDFCYGDRPLSPHWDLFQFGVEFGERESEEKIADLEEELKKWKDGIALKDEEIGCIETEFNTFKSKAKEIIREFVQWATWQGSNCPNFKSIQDKAEQFLKENEE